MLLPHRTLKEADGIASQLVNAIDALPSTALIDREAFLHIGIVAYRSGQTTEQVIDYAEQATRHATLQGENGWYVYDSQVPEKARQRQVAHVAGTGTGARRPAAVSETGGDRGRRGTPS